MAKLISIAHCMFVNIPFRCRRRPSLHTRPKSNRTRLDEVNKCSSVQGDEALTSRPRRQRSAPIQFVARPSNAGGDAGISEPPKPTCWSAKEDKELTKLVNKYGTSWRDCLDNSRIWKKKFEHISDEAARDRLRRRWHVISSSRFSDSNDDGFFSQHNDLCEVCNEPGELLCCGSCNLVFHVKVSNNNDRWTANCAKI